MIGLYQSKFYGKCKSDRFKKNHALALANCDFRNLKISQNYKKTSMFYYKTELLTVHSQNLIKNCRNFESGFFPDSPDPVFSRKKECASSCIHQNFKVFCPKIDICFYVKIGVGAGWGRYKICKKPILCSN